jgi:hypothetical protein
MTADTAERSPTRTLIVQWACAVIPLLAWSTHLAFVYLFAPTLCSSPQQAWLYILTSTALIVDGMAGVVAWRGYRASPRKPHATDREAIRARYFGLLGTSSGAIFAVGIAGQTISFLSSCP